MPGAACCGTSWRGKAIIVGRLHVATLMKRMAIEAIYRRPNTSKPAPGHKIYPYLLRKLPVTRPNQVWAMDITYIPMARGFVYLVAVIDWFSRRCWPGGCRSRMETDFCIEALEEALARYGKPGDLQHRPGLAVHQRSDFTGLLIDTGITISMDGKGAWRDNVFVERLWRIGQIRGGLSQRLRHRQPMPARRSADISTSTTADARIRASAGKHRTTPTSTSRFSRGGLTRPTIHLSSPTSLFKQTEPPLR